MKQPIKHYSFHDKVRAMSYKEFKEHFSGVYPPEFLEQAAREMKLKGIGKTKEEKPKEEQEGDASSLG